MFCYFGCTVPPPPPPSTTARFLGIHSTTTNSHIIFSFSVFTYAPAQFLLLIENLISGKIKFHISGTVKILESPSKRKKVTRTFVELKIVSIPSNSLWRPVIISPVQHNLLTKTNYSATRFKAPANEETMYPCHTNEKIAYTQFMHCACSIYEVQSARLWNLGNIVSSARKLGNICWRNKMFLKKVKNIFCFSEAKMFPQQMCPVRANGKTFRDTIFPQKCFLVCEDLYHEHPTHQS